MQVQSESKMEVENAEAKENKQILIHTLLQQLSDTLSQLDKSLANKETRTTSKLTKQVRKYRNIINSHHLLAVVEATGLNWDKQLLIKLPKHDSAFNQKFELPKSLLAKISKNVEVQGFLQLLYIQVLWREKKYQACLNSVNSQLNNINQANRRSLDNYNSILFGLLSRIYEKKNQDLSIRDSLLESYNRACVRKDQLTQAVLLNLLLRNYLKYNHYEAAYNLIEKIDFPQSRSNNEFCRYLYYTGKVQAVRGEYDTALNSLNQAIRKSPDVAKGFKITCQKAAIVVELLKGEVPNREIFSDQLFFKNLNPYFRLIQVVLEGQLSSFNKNVQHYKAVYQKDRLYTMILRLNKVVIRLGLRKIYLAYSNIHLNDISKKLNIPSEDVEFVVAKAIRDGILKGEIDHEKQTLKIQTNQNIYVTSQPQNALDRRIKYCLSLYHQIQKSITYPEVRWKGEQERDDEVDNSELLQMFDFSDL